MQIQPLTTFDKQQFIEIARGYVSTQKYVVRKQEADALTTFTIQLEDLETPFVKSWLDDPPDYAEYSRIAASRGYRLERTTTSC